MLPFFLLFIYFLSFFLFFFYLLLFSPLHLTFSFTVQELLSFSLSVWKRRIHTPLLSGWPVHNADIFYCILFCSLSLECVCSIGRRKRIYVIFPLLPQRPSYSLSSYYQSLYSLPSRNSLNLWNHSTVHSFLCVSHCSSSIVSVSLTSFFLRLF